MKRNKKLNWNRKEMELKRKKNWIEIEKHKKMSRENNSQIDEIKINEKYMPILRKSQT